MAPGIETSRWGASRVKIWVEDPARAKALMWEKIGVFEDRGQCDWRVGKRGDRRSGSEDVGPGRAQ